MLEQEAAAVVLRAEFVGRFRTRRGADAIFVEALLLLTAVKRVSLTSALLVVDIFSSSASDCSDRQAFKGELFLSSEAAAGSEVDSEVGLLALLLSM